MALHYALPLRCIIGFFSPISQNRHRQLSWGNVAFLILNAIILCIQIKYYTEKMYYLTVPESPFSVSDNKLLVIHFLLQHISELNKYKRCAFDYYQLTIYFSLWHILDFLNVGDLISQRKYGLAWCLGLSYLSCFCSYEMNSCQAINITFLNPRIIVNYDLYIVLWSSVAEC